MFEQIWKKYLPVIKILMKQARDEEKVLQMNKIDFEKALLLKKSALRFRLDFENGKPTNLISNSILASSLARALEDSEGIRDILSEATFTFKMNNKYQLTITTQGE